MAAAGEEQLPLLSRLEKVICCEVCLDSYTDPRVLACGHQFCLTCLEKLAQPAEGRHHVIYIRVSCPQCRAPTRLRQLHGIATQLPRPFVAMEMQEAIRDVLAGKTTDDRRHHQQLPCHVCRASPAVSYCLECNDELCERCAKGHAEDKIAHKVLVISDMIMCTTHVRAVSNVFCFTCESVICKLCAREDHHGHRAMPLSDKSQKLREKTDLDTSDDAS